MDKIKKLKQGKFIAEKMVAADAVKQPKTLLGFPLASVVAVVVVVSLVAFIIDVYIKSQRKARQFDEKTEKGASATSEILSPEAASPGSLNLDEAIKSSPFASPAALKQAQSKKANSSPMKEKKGKIDTNQFIYQLTEGVNVNKYRAPDSNKSTDKRKTLRLKKSGDLYWHKDGGIFFSKPETWPLKELSSCFVDHGQQKTGGEVFLTFTNAKTKSERLLEFVVEEEKQRAYIVSAFQKLIEQLQHELEHVMKIVADCCDGNPPTNAKGSQGVPAAFPQFPALNSPSTPSKDKDKEKSSNLRILTGSNEGGGGGASRSMSYKGNSNIDMSAPVTPGKGKYDSDTDLHSLTVKELNHAIKQERMEDYVIGHPDRLDIIKALEVHYKNKNRSACGLPVVEVREDFYNQVKEIYSQIKPEKIDSIPEILEIWKGREDQLLEELINKYDIKEEHHHLLTPTGKGKPTDF